MFKPIVKLGSILLTLLLVAGCWQIDYVVKVNKDGSGTVEETVLISTEMEKMVNEIMASMAAAMGMPLEEDGSQASDVMKMPELLDLQKLKAAANDMGESVTFVSAKNISKPGFSGYQAIYAFEDINKLKINMQQNDKAAMGPQDNSDAGSVQGAQKDKDIVRFKMKSGSTSTLTIMMPQQKMEAGDESSGMDEGSTAMPGMGDDPDNPMQKQIMEMMKKMRMVISIEPQGKIVETNAMHRQGSRLVLFEMDFEKMMIESAEDEQKLQQLQQANPETMEDMKKLMKDIPGFKIELNETVSVKFK